MRYKNKYPYRENIQRLLRPNEVPLILAQLGITWDSRKVNAKGWILICSPLREDKKPSFSINIYKGCFIDFANREVKGGLVQLVEIMKNMTEKRAEMWILSTLNLNLNLPQHE